MAVQMPGKLGKLLGNQQLLPLFTILGTDDLRGDYLGLRTCWYVGIFRMAAPLE